MAADLRGHLAAAFAAYEQNQPNPAIAALQRLRAAANAAIADRDQRLAFAAKVNDLIDWMLAIRSGAGVPQAPPDDVE